MFLTEKQQPVESPNWNEWDMLGEVAQFVTEASTLDFENELNAMTSTVLYEGRQVIIPYGQLTKKKRKLVDIRNKLIADWKEGKGTKPKPLVYTKTISSYQTQKQASKAASRRKKNDTGYSKSDIDEALNGDINKLTDRQKEIRDAVAKAKASGKANLRKKKLVKGSNSNWATVYNTKLQSTKALNSAKMSDKSHGASKRAAFNSAKESNSHHSTKTAEDATIASFGKIYSSVQAALEAEATSRTPDFTPDNNPSLLKRMVNSILKFMGDLRIRIIRVLGSIIRKVRSNIKKRGVSKEVATKIDEINKVTEVLVNTLAKVLHQHTADLKEARNEGDTLRVNDIKKIMTNLSKSFGLLVFSMSNINDVLSMEK